MPSDVSSGSADGVSWTGVDVPRTLTLSTALLAGLVLATDDETRLGEAAFDQVTLTAAVPDVLITEPTDGTTHAANGASLGLVATLTCGSGAAILWSVVSGPGNVTFSNATAATTHAAFSAPGVYRPRQRRVWRCRASRHQRHFSNNGIVQTVKATLPAGATALFVRLRISK